MASTDSPAPGDVTADSAVGAGRRAPPRRRAVFAGGVPAPVELSAAGAATVPPLLTMAASSGERLTEVGPSPAAGSPTCPAAAGDRAFFGDLLGAALFVRAAT
ncbi:MAG: hypothetical protein ACRDZ8_12345 [Acidimicrobiales bacterium]